MATTLNDEQVNYLKSIYFKPTSPVAFSGLDKVWKYIRHENVVTKNELKRWLLEQDSYTSFRPVRYKFKRARVISPYKNYLWMTDTANMLRYADSNNGYSYFVVFIDTFTRYLLAYPLKTLKGTEMVDAIKQAFTRQKCDILYSDAGTEYTAKVVEKYLKKENVKQYFSRSDTKSSMAERVIKTIKGKLHRYMEEKNTFTWYDVLDDFVVSYNNSFHSAIKMTPTQAQNADQHTVWKNQYQTQRRTRARRAAHLTKPKQSDPFKFNINDDVKLSAKRRSFQREYDQRYTTETFLITGRRKKGNISLYKIKDLNNQGIIGEFQDDELTKVLIPTDKTYKIDKVIKQRRRNKKTEYFVSWRGWPKQFNTWVDNITQL